MSQQQQQILPKGYQFVGKLPIDQINKLLGTSFPNLDVLHNNGFVKHVQKDHPGIWENYGHLLPNMISSPDYVGQNPKEPNSLEIYKRINVNLLLAIKLDSRGHYSLSSLYDLKNGEAKIEKRLKAGRIKEYTTL